MNLLNALNAGVWDSIVDSLKNLWASTGLYDLVANFTTGGWQNLVMIAIACLLVYLAIVKKFEPLLLLPIAFGMFIVNIPGVYRILFGDKGYIITDKLASTEVARGTLEELYAYFNVPTISFEAFEELLRNENSFVYEFFESQGYTLTATYLEDSGYIYTLVREGGEIFKGEAFALFNEYFANPSTEIFVYWLEYNGITADMFVNNAAVIEFFGERDLLVKLAENGSIMLYQIEGTGADAVVKTIYTGGMLEVFKEYFVYSEMLNSCSITQFNSDFLGFFLACNAETVNGVGYEMNQLVLSTEQVIENYGLFYYIYKGVDWVIFPPLIFLGIGAMTDFGPLIANPRSMIIGAAAQIGIFITFIGAHCLLGFTGAEAGAIGIIGGADGPTAIYVTKKLAEDLLPAIAIAAYSYMALIPVIQKPIMRALTTEKERAIKMKQLRPVSKKEKIVFPLLVCLVVGLLLPDAMPLLGMLMLGNLLKESGVCGRLVDTAQNGLMNAVTIFLGVMVGSKATGAVFLSGQTLGIIALGLCAFIMGTIGGLLVAKLMCKLTKGKINPLIGSAGVSAVPMAARISQDVGRETDPSNHLLMHAMGPNVAGVISSAIAAGVLLALFG